MENHKNVARGGANAQKGTSLTSSSHRGKAGDIHKADNNLRDNVPLLKEGLSQIGTPSKKMPFRILLYSQSHHSNLYCLSIHKFTLPLKIRCATASILE